MPVLAGVLAWGAVLLVARNPAAQISIRVDLEADGGSGVQVFVNDYSEPIRLPIVTGRQAYVFSTPRNPIRLIRLDPTDASDVSIRLFSVEIVAPDGQVLYRFGASDLEHWTIRGLTTVDTSTGALTARSANNTPFLIGQFSPVGIAASSDGRAAFARRVRSERWLAWVLLFPLLSVLEIRPFGPWLLRAAAAAGVMAIWPWIFRSVTSIDWGPTPSVVAISRAAFLGVSLPTTQMAVAAGFAAAGLVGLIVALRRPAAEPASRAPTTISARFVGLVWLAAVFVTAPDLAGMLDWYKVQRYSPHWDGDNLLTWTYWSAVGHLPYRDFWFPYGGQFLFDRSWPAGPLLAWAAAAGRYAVFASALALGSEGRRAAAVLATVTLLAVDTSGMHLQSPRYLMGINMVLAFVAASRSEFRERLALVTMAVALGMALVFDSVQILYAAPAIGAVAGMDILKRRRLGNAWRGPVFCTAVVFSVCVPLFAGLAAHGALSDALAFHTTLTDTVQYAALPTTVEPDWWPAFGIASIVAWFPAGALLVGLVEYRRPDLQARLRASAVIGLAALNFIALQKHLVRPMPETLVLYAVVTGLAFGALRAEGPLSRHRIGLGAALGLLAAVLTLTGRLGTSWQSTTRIPDNVTRTVQTLLTPRASAEANRERFAPERFELYQVERALVATLSSRRGGPVRLFALSDDPILYVLTKQFPVWQTNLYNASPTYEQQRVVAALRNDPPDYMVAIPGRLTFDLVPVAVRNPDVVALAVDRYVPDAPVDPYLVLRPRRDGEPVQPAFWRTLFGDTLDLGMLPLSLADTSYPPCTPAAVCQELLVLTALGPAEERTGSIGLEIARARIDLTFGMKPDVRRYVIPLSRLWPGVAARAAGLSLDVVATDGFTVERRVVGRPPGRLY
jgi:hypothetical protein